jgi:hypothetical protein
VNGIDMKDGYMHPVTETVYRNEKNLLLKQSILY